MSASETTGGPAWQRLHPLTPLLRGGKVLLALTAIVGQQTFSQDAFRPPAYVVGLSALALTALAVAGGYISWRRTGYRLTETELQVDNGILTRRSRRVPLARLQSVEVVRPIVGRVLGMAELRLEVVGGGSAEAPLAYLSEGDAQELRAQMLAGSRGATPAEPTHPPPERVLVVVPSRTLVTSLLLAGPSVVLAVLAVAVLVVALFDATVAGAVGLALLPAVLPVGIAVVNRFLTEYGFTVAETEGGLRITRGLLDTRASSIPDGRVQGVRITEPLLWRRRNWVRVEVDVAGYAAGRGEQTTSTALLPVAPRELATALVSRVLGGALPEAASPAPSQARWRAPFSHRRLRHGLDERHLVTTSGVLTTTTVAVPLTKVQSVRRTAGPWQRRLHLASVHADSAGRRISAASARHRAEEQAAELVEALATRSRAARGQAAEPST